MQVCFFALSGVLPKDEAIEAIKNSIKKTYGKKGDEVVQMNLKAVDNTLAHLHEVPVVNNKVNGAGPLLPPISPDAPEFVRNVLGKIAAGFGDELPVSAFPNDGSFPTGDGAIRKTQSRAGNSGVGRENLHPMFEVRGHLPARHDPRKSL